MESDRKIISPRCRLLVKHSGSLNIFSHEDGLVANKKKDNEYNNKQTHNLQSYNDHGGHLGEG